MKIAVSILCSTCSKSVFIGSFNRWFDYSVEDWYATVQCTQCHIGDKVKQEEKEKGEKDGQHSD